MPGDRILVVEDDTDINEVVGERLRRDGHDVSSACNGAEALMAVGADRFDLIVTDLMLPGATGESLVETLRSSGTTMPIIVISAKESLADRVGLLRLGADDYLVKPFDLDELAARVNAQLRGRGFSSAAGRSHRESSEDGWSVAAPALVLGRWRLDPSARSFAIDGQPITLTNLEFNILELLMAHPDRVFTKAQLYEACWGESWMGDDNTVTAHVSKVRAKLKPSGTDSYLRTVWGLGWKASATK